METKCDHTKEIANELYNTYQSTLSHAPRATDLSKEPEAVKQAWYHVADRALPIIGKHATDDLKKYAKTKFGASSGWAKALWGLIAGAALAAGATLFSSCSLADRIQLEGDKGAISYYIDPSSGQSVLIVSPTKILADKK